jgi:hypothetical protein
MKPGIHFKKIWFDNDVVELRIESFDGDSFFTTKVYVGHQDFDALIEGLNAFKDHVYGGIFNIKLGGFGPEYANGAFDARLHFQNRGKIHVTIKSQSDYKEFGDKNVASEATLYLISEPGLLDNFIGELRQLQTTVTDEATLEAA